jgi:Skp family chaperone for outer membrane proteins
MRRFAAVGLMLSTLLLGFGCEQKPAAGAGGSGVAVLDTGRIVQAMGWGPRLDAQMNEVASQLRQQILEQIQRRYEAQVAQGGPMASPQYVQQIRQQAQADVMQAAAQAEARARQQIFAELTQQIAPAAQAVASSRGVAMVMERPTGLILIDQSVDITDAVIAELKKSAPAAGGPTGSATPSRGNPFPGGDLPFQVSPATRPATAPTTQPS